MAPQNVAERPLEGIGFEIGGAVVLEPVWIRKPESIGDLLW